MAQADQHFQQQAQPHSRQHGTGKGSRHSNGKDRKLQANGSPNFDSTQDAAQSGNAFGRPSRQSSGSNQNMTGTHGNGASASRHYDPATINRLPQSELEQIQISRRAEIARLQAEVDLAAQTMQERSDLQKMTEKLAASVERRIFAEGRERSSKELLSRFQNQSSEKSSTSFMQEVMAEVNQLKAHNHIYEQKAAMTGEEYNEMEEQLQNINDEVRSLETQLSAHRKESMQKEATLRDIVESRIQTIRELSDEQQELEHRLASKCESYEETMLVLSEWQTYGNSRDAQLSDVNQEVQKLRSEIAVLRNQADGDRREINSLRQQISSQPLPQPPAQGPSHPTAALFARQHSGPAADTLHLNGPVPPQHSQQQLTHLTQFAQQQGIPISQQMGQQQQQHPPLPPPPEQQQSYSGQLQADRSGSARILDPDSLGGLCLSAMPRGEAHAQPLAQIAATVAAKLRQIGGVWERDYQAAHGTIDAYLSENLHVYMRRQDGAWFVSQQQLQGPAMLQGPNSQDATVARPGVNAGAAVTRPAPGPYQPVGIAPVPNRTGAQPQQAPPQQQQALPSQAPQRQHTPQQQPHTQQPAHNGQRQPSAAASVQRQPLQQPAQPSPPGWQGPAPQSKTQSETHQQPQPPVSQPSQQQQQQQQLQAQAAPPKQQGQRLVPPPAVPHGSGHKQAQPARTVLVTPLAPGAQRSASGASAGAAPPGTLRHGSGAGPGRAQGRPSGPGASAAPVTAPSGRPTNKPSTQNDSSSKQESAAAGQQAGSSKRAGSQGAWVEDAQAPLSSAASTVPAVSAGLPQRAPRSKGRSGKGKGSGSAVVNSGSEGPLSQ